MEIVPPFKNYVVRKMSEVMAETKLQEKDFKDSMGIEYLKIGFRFFYTQFCLKPARFDKKAPNATVLSMDGKTKQLLLDLQKTSRPLVVNIGSCP